VEPQWYINIYRRSASVEQAYKLFCQPEVSSFCRCLVESNGVDADARNASFLGVSNPRLNIQNISSVGIRNLSIELVDNENIVMTVRQQR
jgi:hypothetical protein